MNDHQDSQPERPELCAQLGAQLAARDSDGAPKSPLDCVILVTARNANLDVTFNERTAEWGGHTTAVRRLAPGSRAAMLVADLMAEMRDPTPPSSLEHPQPAPPLRGTLAPWQFRRVTEFMEANLAQDIGLGELAAMVGLSAFHFARCFRVTAGMPPHRYLIERRIARAKDMLTQSDDSISDIAGRVGYDDASYFARLFSREVGETPGTYRRRRTV